MKRKALFIGVNEYEDRQIRNLSSPTYVQTCVIAEAPAATDGGDAANNE